MCHHRDVAVSWEEIREHEPADEEADEHPDEEPQVAEPPADD